MSDPSLEGKRRGKPAVINDHGGYICVNHLDPTAKVGAKIEFLENALEERVVYAIKSFLLIKAYNSCRELFKPGKIDRRGFQKCYDRGPRKFDPR